MDIRSLLKRLLKLYGVFAVLNVLNKILVPFMFRRRARKLWKHLPGKDADPFAVSFRKYGKRFHDFYSDFVLRHPEADLIKLDVPNVALLCNSPEAVKWMLKDEFANSTKPGPENEMFTFMRRFLGEDGIFVIRHGEKYKSDNEMWFKQRKVASKIFTKANFKTLFYDTFVEKSEVFVRQLERTEGQKVDLQSLFFSFTMDSIEKFFMGVDVDTVSGGMSNYGKAFDAAHNAMMNVVLGNIPLLVASKMVIPFPFGALSTESDVDDNLLVKWWFSRDKEHKKFVESIRQLDSHVYSYISETRNDPDLKSRKDIIANFLNSKIGDSLSDETLRNIVLNLTIAGRDTTACALSWMFFELTQNLQVQEQLLKEVDTKLKGDTPTMKALEADNMPYLNGVIFETLRLHPPVPTDSKVIQKETTYHDGTVIPANTECVFSPRGIGRNPKRFPDPLKFDPNRWIPFVQPSLYEFPVFQAGPRFCLGKDMAVFEMKLLATKLLQSFKFTMEPIDAEKVSYSLMLTQSIAINEEKNDMKLLVTAHKRL